LSTRPPAGGFGGFGPQALGFFKALSFHQSKAWFEENRALYESDVKAPFQALLADLTRHFAATGMPFRADPQKAMFRLNRDIRFAREKHPYKTHAGAVLSRDGTKSSPGLLYIHIDPRGCFTGAGFWQPEPDQLEGLRQAVRRRPEAWQAMLDRLAAAGLALSGEGAMKRLPRGFEDMRGSPHEPAFRYRSFVTFRPLPEHLITTRELVPSVTTFALEALPLLEFGWRALADRRA
jgi:uncharacterized protein (TIGR02453 family)